LFANPREIMQLEKVLTLIEMNEYSGDCGQNPSGTAELCTEGAACFLRARRLMLNISSTNFML
jgi:hypothetical protein